MNYALHADYNLHLPAQFADSSGVARVCARTHTQIAWGIAPIPCSLFEFMALTAMLNI